MINSCCYSTNGLVLFKFQIFNQDLSWCLASIKDSKSSFEANSLSRSASQNTVEWRRDESWRHLYARKIRHVYAL